MPTVNTTVNRPVPVPAAPKPDPAPAPSATPAATVIAPPPDAPAVAADVVGNLSQPGAPAADAHRLGIPGLTRLTLEQAERTQPFTLVPGRYPDAVGLPDVLARAGSSPEGAAAVKQLAAALTRKTGIAVPDALVTAALANPARLLAALQVTPAQMAAGMLAVNAEYKAGKLKPDAPAAYRLPARADLAQLSQIDFPRPPGALKEVFPGLLQGDVPSGLPDAQAKCNTAMAEVFSRLAGNANAAAGQRFTAVYAGREFTALDPFLDALRKDGCTVEVSVEQRVANFADLKARAPDGSIVDVPAPLMVRTGLKDPAGQEAVVPAAHSELVIRVRRGGATRGPAVDADVKYYQGVSGTGFFPIGLMREPAWCGRVRHDELSGDRAWQAVKLAGVMTSVINRSAEAQHLWNGGYGVTGVCNDSVAVVQQAVTGHTSCYPLLMKDAAVVPELRRRLADRSKRDDAQVRALLDAVRTLPSDARANPSARQRAFESLPWAAGQEPFESSVNARAILAAP